MSDQHRKTMAETTPEELSLDLATDPATHLDTALEEQSLSTNDIYDPSHTHKDIEFGFRFDNMPENINVISMRFEGGECVVPPSLPEEEASSASKGIRDVFLQPVDHQTPSSAALPLSALFNSEAYDNYRKMTCVPSTSETAYESPSARPHTSTLTRDVPDLFEEPLAAVGVCTTLPSASIPLLSTTKYQSNSPSTSTLTDCRPNTRTTPRPSGGRPRRSTASSGSSTCSSVNSPTRSQTLAIQWNICGLRSHYNELQMLITKYQPVVVCLQETNLDYRKSCDGLLGTNYHLLLSQCSTHGRQGAGLAIKSGMPF